LIKDKEYKIYSAALKFDKTKGAKFSTYLGNETKWMCLNSYNKNKRRPAFHAENIENMPENNDPQENSIESNIKRDLFNKVLSLISKHPDKRVEKIFNMRYIIGQRNKVMPWKDIGSEMNLSIQGCINIHNSVVNYIQDELSEEIEGGL
jgi:DNA-directed RNA polymerase sigma subunit (sigma70/sigma32)